MRYLVTKEIKSETQVMWTLYLQDFAFLVIWFIVNGMYLQNIVHPYLQIPFTIYSVLVGIVFVTPSTTNPKRRQYQSIVLFLTKKKNVYYLREGKKNNEQKEQKQNRKHQKRNSYRKI